MSKIFAVWYTLAIAGLMCANSAHAIATPTSPRTFVASTGVDTNACSRAAPCRTFAAAVPLTSYAGEIVVLDSAGYGPITITQSITITSPPGVYAGITVTAGNGININAPYAGTIVTLRGLTINGQGGVNGISVTSVSELFIDHCVISNFDATGEAGITVDAFSNVKISNTQISQAYYGVFLGSGAEADIAHTQIFETTYGVYVSADTTPTVAVLSNDVITYASSAVFAKAYVAGTVARTYVAHSTLSSVGYGVHTQATAGTVYAAVNDCLVTETVTALFNEGGAGSATLETFGNNVLRGNSATSGTVTKVSPG